MGVKYYSLYDFTLGRERDGVYEVYVDGEWVLDVGHRMEDAFIGITNQEYGLDQYDWNYHKGCLIFEITEEEAERLKNFREDWTVNCFLVSYIMRIVEDIYFYYLIDNDLTIAGIIIDKNSKDYRYEIPIEEWNKMLQGKNYGTGFDSHSDYLEEYFNDHIFEELSDYLFVNDVYYSQAFIGYGIAGGIHNVNLASLDLDDPYDDLFDDYGKDDSEDEDHDEEEEYDEYDEYDDWPDFPIKERE